MEYKQVILIRTDLKISRGKIAAQVAHASVESMTRANKNLVAAWRKGGMKKVVLRVSSKKELLDYWHMAKATKLATALIKDAGRTEIEPGTMTCLGIGPDEERKIDKITGNLKIL